MLILTRWLKWDERISGMIGIESGCVNMGSGMGMGCILATGRNAAKKPFHIYRQIE
jgi:hypothetical protein